MATSDHERLEQLFTAALEKSSDEELSLFLDQSCGEDARLRERLTDLLMAHGRAGSFLDSPPVDPDVCLQPEGEGTMIGRYKIMHSIGEGGFGSVYMAEQEEPVSRSVALKIIKLGMDTKQVIARFEAERQALALMDHPNIARVFDAGATATGRPYFVMELVKGISITKYCERNALGVKERLELFLQVCHAVQHAHQKGIIHRDLKPNNVLVATVENRAVPKVIDFGIAKATSQRLTDKTLHTEFRQFLGTPEYMSPDQADVGGLDMDTRTDIYSLGVLLYELLTTTTPFGARMSQQISYEDISRIIREEEPSKPSTRLQSLAAGPSEEWQAKFCHAKPLAVARLVRGDLDWITMKALEKDRTRRYATAKDLADDVERHLRNDPVLAGPPGVSYKLKKFVYRHRVGVVAGAAVILTSIGGLSLATVALIKAERSRVEAEAQRDAARESASIAREERARAEAKTEEAERELARSTTVCQYLEEMLRSVEPGQALGREVTVRYVLDEAVGKIDDGTLRGQPEVEATVRLTLGQTYQALGLYVPAEEHIRAARELRERRLGPGHPDTLDAHRSLAGVLRVKGEFAAAESLLRETAATQERVLGAEHPQTLATQNELALALWGPGRFEEAESIHRHSLEICRRVFGEEHPDTVRAMGYLGAECRALGKAAEAERLLTRAHDLCGRVMGEEHPATATILNDLGLLRLDQGEYEQAELAFRRAYELDLRVLGADHSETLSSLDNLVRALRRQDKSEAMRPLVAERIARLRREAQAPSAGVRAHQLYAWELLNCELDELRDAEAALPAAQRAVELEDESNPETLELLALAYYHTGNLEMAIETQSRAVEEAAQGGVLDLPGMRTTLIDYHIEGGDLVAAVGMAVGSLSTDLEALFVSSDDPDAPLAVQGEALMAEGRYDEAVEVLRVCLSMREKGLPEGHWLVAETSTQLGAALAGQGEYIEAESLMLGACASLQANRQVSFERKGQALQRLVDLYEAWGNPEQASEWRRRLDRLEGGLDEED